MKKYYLNILLLFSSAFYSGCTSTYFVSTHSLKTERDTITINQLQQKLQDKTVNIILRDNRQIQAENITFSKDTVTFTIPPDLKQNEIPLVAIKKIERRLHSDGAFAGAFCGWLCGGIVGITYLSLAPNNSDDFGFKKTMTMTEIVVVGFLAGGIYGGIRGNIEEYIFDSDIYKHAP